MNILDQIIAYKQQFVAQSKAQRTVEQLEQSPLFARDTLSLKAFVLDQTKTGIIAEFKRKSPSKGIINDQVSVAEVTAAYAQFGASGLSVLSDEQFFGGSLKDVEDARFNQIPLLRKEFIIDEYQILEAKAHGADVILLIAACLSPQRVKELAVFAKNLGLEVLLELHTEEELEHICSEVDLVGVNNRNLKTFEVDLEHSIRLSAQIGDRIKIAESGISQIENILYLKENGFHGFLIGETFMKQADPGAAFAGFINDLKSASCK